MEKNGRCLCWRSRSRDGGIRCLGGRRGSWNGHGFAACRGTYFFVLSAGTSDGVVQILRVAPRRRGNSTLRPIRWFVMTHNSTGAGMGSRNAGRGRDGSEASKRMKDEGRISASWELGLKPRGSRVCSCM